MKTATLIQSAVAEFRGLGAGRFYSTPDEVKAAMAQQEQQGPPPDPKMIEAQGKLQIAGQKAQADMQLQGAKMQSGVQQSAMKVQADAQSKAQATWMKFQADLAKIQANERTDRMELIMQGQLEREAIRAGSPKGQGDIPRRK